jgi:hypothetical protein
MVLEAAKPPACQVHSNNTHESAAARLYIGSLWHLRPVYETQVLRTTARFCILHWILLSSALCRNKPFPPAAASAAELMYAVRDVSR